MIGAESLVESLKKEGVEHIFGIPGAALIDVYDVLYDDGQIDHILTRHEQGAARAADGYARATGRPGVCMATSGPGAQNPNQVKGVLPRIGVKIRGGSRN